MIRKGKKNEKQTRERGRRRSETDRAELLKESTHKKKSRRHTIKGLQEEKRTGEKTLAWIPTLADFRGQLCGREGEKRREKKRRKSRKYRESLSQVRKHGETDRRMMWRST
mmetsp:Transcript_31092/g.61309  ORF Transcript_31092/g.61309 Transcript_31092/m.61309 type:complete len:111 (-) Transcript_31092:469-801(-)